MIGAKIEDRAESSPERHSPPPTTDVLDAEWVAMLRSQRRPGAVDIMAEIAETYLGDLAGRLSALRAALENDDARALGWVAHELSGSSGNIGALRLAAACAELEKLSRSGTLDHADELVGEIEVRAAEVRGALESEAWRAKQ
jgi:HPt (histidine-containing phosphotransfer) domain-containing protein